MKNYIPLCHLDISNKYNGYWLYCTDDGKLYNYDANSFSAPYIYKVDTTTHIFHTTDIDGSFIPTKYEFKHIKVDNFIATSAIGAGIVEEELLSVIIANI
jgi:hypothetical protein